MKAGNHCSQQSPSKIHSYCLASRLDTGIIELEIIVFAILGIGLDIFIGGILVNVVLALKKKV